MTIAGAATVVLQEVNRPMHTREIYAQIDSRKLFAFKAKNPVSVVSGALRNSPQFEKTAPGTFKLVGKDAKLFRNHVDVRKFIQTNEAFIFCKKISNAYMRFIRAFKNMDDAINYMDELNDSDFYFPDAHLLLLKESELLDILI